MSRKRPSKKQLDQAELKEINAIQITLVASEANLQRIAAFLMFADHHRPLYEVKTNMPLPYETTQELTPVLEINRPLLEQTVGKLLAEYVEEHGREKTQAMIQSFGAERAFALSDEQLLSLHRSLAGEAAHE